MSAPDEHKLQTLPAARTTYNLLSLYAFRPTVEFTDTGSSYSITESHKDVAADYVSPERWTTIYILLAV